MSNLQPEKTDNEREITLPPPGCGNTTKGQHGQGGSRKGQTVGVAWVNEVCWTALLGAQLHPMSGVCVLWEESSVCGEATGSHPQGGGICTQQMGAEGVR